MTGFGGPAFVFLRVGRAPNLHPVGWTGAGKAGSLSGVFTLLFPLEMFPSMGSFFRSLRSIGSVILSPTLGRGEAPEVGSTAAEFELAASDGKTYRLSSLLEEHEVVVVAWFPKAFTPGCTAECSAFRKQGGDIRDYNVAYFTASCDTVEENAEFAKSLSLDYPILCDPTRETAKAYGVVDSDSGWARRWTFYIGQDRKILFVDTSGKTGDQASEVAARSIGVG